MNGWRLQSSLFFDDLDYVAKAGADDVAWGTPVPTSRTRSPTSSTTARGRPLEGRYRYTLTFDVNDLPPTTEFWELPVYDSAGYFIDNPVDRYSATSELLKAATMPWSTASSPLLAAGAADDPEQARNWLPTSPSDGFQLAARFYGPTRG
ncbi:DUF1214 domain-containing protein [Rhodococcus hoagii]|nr:DUF1214 domain-containing protein [Prescottella equi]